MFNNLNIAMVDIDGTLKDLVDENNNALLRTMMYFGHINLKKRGKIVLAINKINMYFVKTGLLPTNSFMQNILIFIYSLLLMKKYDLFKAKYFEEYNKENIFFKDSEKMIKLFYDNNMTICLVTKNVQNKNILSLYKSEVKYANMMKYVSKVIVGEKNTGKYAAYKSFLDDNNFINNNKIIVVGDNFWDDVLPALLLGNKVIWCNKYNCRFKSVIIKILKLLNKNVLSDDKIIDTYV